MSNSVSPTARTLRYQSRITFQVCGAALVASVLAFPSLARAETWTVVEGDKGAVHGVWQVSIADSKLTGNAAMISPKGKPLTYQLGGTVRNGKLVAQRIQPSDRAGCTYVADMSRANKFAGVALCEGSSHPWLVTRTGKR